jgi:hypothetical protein
MPRQSLRERNFFIGNSTAKAKTKPNVGKDDKRDLTIKCEYNMKNK